MSKAGKGSDSNFTDSPKVEARRKRNKKIAIIALVASATAASLLLVVGLQGTGGQLPEGDFTVQLHYPDSLDAENHFFMGSRPGTPGEDPKTEGVTTLVGEPLGTATVTTNAAVREGYKSLLDGLQPGEALSGSSNLVGADEIPYCLVYTFYLTNVSETETQHFNLIGRLNHDPGQPNGAVGVNIYEYARFGLFMGDNGQPDDDVRYFANANSRMVGTISDPEDFETANPYDYKECLATYGFKTQYFVDGTEKTYRYPKYTDAEAKPSPISYCENFEPNAEKDYPGRGLFNLTDLTINPGASRRITFLAYFEIDDPDCTGTPPKNQRMGFSLHVGI